MTAFKFKGLLQNKAWICPAFVKIDKKGRLISLSNKKEKGLTYESVNGFALPGMQNAHSHAFQYAMIGLTENHNLNKKADDFWSWRKAMYQLALSITPDHMEVIASKLYIEMLRHGYTNVTEFHYVHHDLSGKEYANKSELGERLIAAAKIAGIKITLIPIFYQKGGFGKAANTGQKRFLSKNLKTYLKLWEASEKSCKQYANAKIGYGVHSLRAVEPTLIKKLSQIINPSKPFHLHISEQLKEVEESINYLGSRPVEWLLNELQVTKHFHLVHATHLNKAETKALAKSAANVVLCPSTEGNLGDGIFPLKGFQKAGGIWCIGTDSHIGLNPFEELRLLDYGQRLTTHQRNTFWSKTAGNSGLNGIKNLVINGRRAMGNINPVFFKKGKPFDVLILNAKEPILQVCSLENLASTIVYASDVSMHLGTMVNGKWVIKRGKHQSAKVVDNQIVKVFKKLKIR